MKRLILLLSIFVSVVSSANTALSYNDQKSISQLNIVCWGDSLTAGAGGKGTTYPNELQKILNNHSIYNFKVYNAGVGGENSATITSRAGGIPFIVRIDDQIIPPNKVPVKISFLDNNNMNVRPLYQGSGLYSKEFIGKLGNIEGKINLIQPKGRSVIPKSSDYYTFTRLNNGEQINFSLSQKFTLDFSNMHKNDIYIIWIGQNDGKDFQNAILNTKAIIDHMTSSNKKFIVMNRPSGNSSRDNEDKAWLKQFPNNFIPIRQYMIKHGLEDAGIKPTLQDEIDINNGTVPSSLRSDQVHFNSQGYKVVANVVFHKMEKLGWIN